MSGQVAELITPAVHWWTQAETVLLLQGFRGGCPVHDIKVAHLITVGVPVMWMERVEVLAENLCKAWWFHNTTIP